jgi:hypothetical protein
VGATGIEAAEEDADSDERGTIAHDDDPLDSGNRARNRATVGEAGRIETNGSNDDSSRVDEAPSASATALAEEAPTPRGGPARACPPHASSMT